MSRGIVLARTPLRAAVEPRLFFTKDDSVTSGTDLFESSCLAGATSSKRLVYRLVPLGTQMFEDRIQSFFYKEQR